MRLLFLFIGLAANIASAAVTLDRKLIQTLRISKTRATVSSARFSPDGKTLYVAWAKEYSDGGGLTAWDTKTSKLKRVFMQRPVFDFEISPDGKTLICDDHYGKRKNRLDILRIWDTASGRLKQTLASKSLSGFAFSSNGKTLATGEIRNKKAVVVLHDMNNRQMQRTFYCKFKKAPGHIAFSSDGTLIAATTFYNHDGFGELQVWNLRTGKTLRHFGYTFGEPLFFLPNCHLLVIGNEKVDLSMAHSKLNPIFRNDPNYSLLIVSWPGRANLCACNVYDDDYAKKHEYEKDADHYSFIDWWDINSRRRVARWKNEPPRMKAMAFSRDGKYFAEWCEADDNSGSQEKYSNAIKIYRLTSNL